MPLPYDGSIAKARFRLGEAVMAEMFAGCAGPVGLPGQEGVFFAGRRVASIDGTVFDAKPTPENLAGFKVPGGGELPQVRMVALAECGTMALLGAEFDSIGVDERTLVERLLNRFTPGMLVLADRGFPSYKLWRDAVATEADLAWRVSASFTLPMIERLADGTYLSELRGGKKSERITVRVVEYSVQDADTGISEVFALITTLTDPVAYPALELARLYACRWQVETLFKILKVEIRQSHAVLRSKSPAMVRQELWGLLCCYQAVRLVAARAGGEAGIDITRIRFPEVLDAVRDSIALAFSPCTLAKALRDLATELPRMLIRKRPDRSTPRVLRRPGRGWPTRKPDTPRTRAVDRELIVHRIPAPPPTTEPMTGPTPEPTHRVPSRPANSDRRPPKRKDPPRPHQPAASTRANRRTGAPTPS